MSMSLKDNVILELKQLLEIGIITKKVHDKAVSKVNAEEDFDNEYCSMSSTEATDLMVTLSSF